MTLNNLLPFLLIIGSGILYFWPKLNNLIPSNFSFNSLNPPHKEMNRIIKFFQATNCKPGLDAAMMTGKCIYDALATPITVVPKPKHKGSSK